MIWKFFNINHLLEQYSWFFMSLSSTCLVGVCEYIEDRFSPPDILPHVLFLSLTFTVYHPFFSRSLSLSLFPSILYQSISKISEMFYFSLLNVRFYRLSLEILLNTIYFFPLLMKFQFFLCNTFLILNRILSR